MSANRSERVPTVADALEALPAAIAAVRTARRLSLRDAAEQMGIPHSNLDRLEKGGNCTLTTLVAAVRWLEGPSSSDDPMASGGTDG